RAGSGECRSSPGRQECDCRSLRLQTDSPRKEPACSMNAHLRKSPPGPRRKGSGPWLFDSIQQPDISSVRRVVIEQREVSIRRPDWIVDADGRVGEFEYLVWGAAFHRGDPTVLWPFTSRTRL